MTAGGEVRGGIHRHGPKHLGPERGPQGQGDIPAPFGAAMGGDLDVNHVGVPLVSVAQRDVEAARHQAAGVPIDGEVRGGGEGGGFTGQVLHGRYLRGDAPGGQWPGVNRAGRRRGLTGQRR